MADAIVMDRNIKALFGVGMISAFILGVYEILFPFYLASRGLSLVGMGLIFSVSTLIVAFFRIFVGEYTDVYGRKKAYMTSSVLSTVSKTLFPFSIDVFAITFNKFLDDLQENIRVSVHNVMLYENTRKAFAKFFSWFTASNFVLQASGNLILAGLLLYFGYSGCFFLLAGIEVIKFAIVLVYREDEVEQKIRKISLKEAFSFKVDKRLKILSVSAAIGTLGFGVAHGFLLPLYFAGKYGLDFFSDILSHGCSSTFFSDYSFCWQDHSKNRCKNDLDFNYNGIRHLILGYWTNHISHHNLRRCLSSP